MARSREDFLLQVMSTGFQRAASSFSKLVNKNVRIVNAESMLVRRENDFFNAIEEDGDLHVLLTNIIGDIGGKSFLIFNRDECQEIFKAIGTSVTNDALKEAFLLEIDNIISASVIAELSNALQLEIYGDVPRLTKLPAANLREFMQREMQSDEPSSMIFCNATFQFEGGDRVHPQFIWRLSSKIFEKLPTEKI
jgi:chemotaxis protein CheY-P-specific phosphatase CheC